MKIEFPSKSTPYHVLGVPSFAKPGQIRSAYLKRVNVLRPYRFNKATQPIEWQIVHDVLQELNEAYAKVRIPNLNKNRLSQTKAKAPSAGKPRPAENNNGVNTRVSVGNRSYNSDGVERAQVIERTPSVKRSDEDGNISIPLSSEFSPAPEFERLLEWVRLDTSHVRNNPACVEKHLQRLRALGETEKRLRELDYWHESPAFTEWERPLWASARQLR